jgi:hypothetical protein
MLKQITKQCTSALYAFNCFYPSRLTATTDANMPYSSSCLKCLIPTLFRSRDRVCLSDGPTLLERCIASRVQRLKSADICVLVLSYELCVYAQPLSICAGLDRVSDL